VKGAHENLEGHEAVRSSSDRSFGVVFAAVFALATISALWTGAKWWPLSAILATAFAALAALRPAMLAPLNRQWTRAGLLLHRVVNPLVMGVMFFGVVLPTGVLMRLVGKDPLRLRRDPAASTYWQPRDPPAPDHFREQF
jgi:hypothetical protein